MRPLMIHTRHFPPQGFHAITIFPVIFYNEGQMSETDIRHETIHLWQQATLLVIPFYLLYFLFWIVNLAKYHDSYTAYRNIPFERSAYSLEKEKGIKPLKKAFDWTHHLRRRDNAL